MPKSALDPERRPAGKTGRYRRRPLVVEASQWFTLGDHPNVEPYRNQLGPAKGPGPHGWIETLEGGHLVTAGDWIITGVKGEVYACKPDIFAATYEPADA
jgi:hypothetical protein